jgi:DeoR/GlpR family transcriptional regulator of sugar metabolism
MFKEKRQQEIINLINSSGSISVEELVSKYNVSGMTIRRDLQELENKGLILRTHGGAIESNQSSNQVEPPIPKRMKVMAREKIQISKEINKIIKPNETIFLGSGSTTTFLARELANRKDIKIVTNSLTVMNELINTGVQDFIGIGGFLRYGEMSFYGHFSDKILQDLIVDRVIMGMRGVHPVHGLTSDHPQELATDRAIINTSDELIIAADHTKIGIIASAKIAPIESASIIVTTKGAPLDIIKNIRKKNVHVSIV